MPRTLTPPPTREDVPVAAPPSAPHRAALTAEPRRAPTGRLTRRAVLLSVGLHVVLAIGVFLVPVVRPRRAPTPAARDSVQYLDIGAFPPVQAGTAAGGGAGELAGPAAPPSATRDTAVSTAHPSPFRFPDRVPVGLPSGLPSGPLPSGPAGVGTAPRSGAAGGRLGAQLGDPRLVVRPDVQVERTLTDEERARQRLDRRLSAINDSLAAESAVRRRQRNWTIRDRSGKEWGFGPDGSTVIAGHRLPLPLPLPVIQRDRDADNAERERLRRWTEIQDQAESADRDRVLRQRANETRRRVDNERRARRGESAADTSRRAP